MFKYSKIIYCLQEKPAHVRMKVSVVYVILSLYMLNCFEYFLIYVFDQNVAKSRQKIFFQL